MTCICEMINCHEPRDCGEIYCSQHLTESLKEEDKKEEPIADTT
jgi:hypothetical protein